MAKENEDKVVLERSYIVPLRKGWLKVPEYKRASKAIKTLKKFISRHMKNYDGDLKKIKIDVDLNNEIRFRGIKKPPAKISVITKKFESGIIKVELSEIPKIIKFSRLRNERIKKLEEKNLEKKKEEKLYKEEEIKKEVLNKDNEKDVESKLEIETKEREETSKEAEMNIAKQKSKEKKHIYKEKKVQKFRKALSK